MVKTLKKFYKFIWRYKTAFLFFNLTLIVSSGIENSIPYLYKLLVDNLATLDYQLLLKIVFAFIGLRVLANLLTTLSWYLGDKAVIPAARDARITIFRKIQNLDFAFHANKNTGSLISAFKRGDSAFFGIFLDLNGDMARILIGLAVSLFLFSQVAPVISLIMLVVFAFNTLISWFLVKNNVKKRAAFNKTEDEISGIITDNLINYETVKFFAQEEKEENRLKEEFVSWHEKVWQYANSFRLMDLVIGTLSSLGALLILWIALNRLVAGQISIGDFVMVSTLITGFYYRFFHLLYRLRDVAKKFTDIEAYLNLLDEEILIKDPPTPVKTNKIRGEIVFKNVGFSYPDGKKNALIDFNLHIKPGEIVAFVGKSGAGKTTITKLLLHFYNVNRGLIAIDGINIKEMAKADLRSFIGVVPQEPILFNNSIGFNLGYGRDRASQKEIEKAVKMANLYEFIQSLPEKYKTEVGERGIKLSGGQKQRLAIARMFLTNPQIIIFDEATSNLDSYSEDLIQDALWKIAKNRTVLIIAHRFSTVRQAHRIVVLDDGRIVQIGPHEKLIKEKGIYQRLWRLQAQGKKPSDLELLV